MKQLATISQDKILETKPQCFQVKFSTQLLEIHLKSNHLEFSKMDLQIMTEHG